MPVLLLLLCPSLLVQARLVVATILANFTVSLAPEAGYVQLQAAADSGACDDRVACIATLYDVMRIQSWRC